MIYLHTNSYIARFTVLLFTAMRTKTKKIFSHFNRLVILHYTILH